MIIGAVFAPAAPFLVPGTARQLAAEQAQLVAAATAAIGALAGEADRVLLYTPGNGVTAEVPQELGPSPFGRSAAGVGDWAAGTLVARTLMPGVALDVVEYDVSGPPMIERHVSVGPERIGLLLLADGSICHGDGCPGVPDERAASFEADLHTALTGSIADLGRWTATAMSLATELGATAPAGLNRLAAALQFEQQTAVAEYFGAPYGVGYHVASWRPSA